MNILERINILEILYDYRWLVIGVLAFFMLNARCSRVDGALRDLEYRLDGLEGRIDSVEVRASDLEYDLDRLERDLDDLNLTGNVWW